VATVISRKLSVACATRSDAATAWDSSVRRFAGAHMTSRGQSEAGNYCWEALTLPPGKGVYMPARSAPPEAGAGSGGGGTERRARRGGAQRRCGGPGARSRRRRSPHRPPAARCARAYIRLCRGGGRHITNGVDSLWNRCKIDHGFGANGISPI